jgi:sialic acid synthase SpsE
MPEFQIGERTVGSNAPTYFVADISANHDGDLARAKALIHLAAESGANAAKFQNFRAAKIVSAPGFAAMGKHVSHQSGWRKSVFEVYREASLPWEWTAELKAECDLAGIEYCSTPYDVEAVDMLDPFVRLYKIGSGDITWPEMVRAVASKGKPVLLATGASDMAEVQRAVGWIRETNSEICVMQCNTNYTGSAENLRHTHINVLQSFRELFPDAVLGLSDHGSGTAAVVGAVALGARVIERHFTDDCSRTGPDHAFSLTPSTWRGMVDQARELEAALGSAEKRVCENERETVLVQRRCARAARDLPAGAVLASADFEILRPATPPCVLPFEVDRLIGMKLAVPVPAGDAFAWSMLAEERLSHIA